MAKHAAIFAKLKKDRYTVQVDGAPGGVSASILDGDDVVESFTAEDMAAVEHEIGSAGFEFPVASVGAAHPQVRLAVVFGRLDPARLAPAPDWPELHPDFAQLIAKLRAAVEQS